VQDSQSHEAVNYCRDVDGLRSSYSYYGNYIELCEARRTTEVDNLGQHRWKILLPKRCFQKAHSPFYSEIMAPTKVDVNKNLLLLGGGGAHF
jgi:hypothetical protein